MVVLFLIKPDNRKLQTLGFYVYINIFICQGIPLCVRGYGLHKLD